MNGMQMLLKQLGLDPEELMRDFDRLKQDIITHLQNQNQCNERMEAKLDLLLSLLQSKEKLLVIPVEGSKNGGQLDS